MSEERKTTRDISIQYPPLGWRQKGRMRKISRYPEPSWHRYAQFLFGLIVGSGSLALWGINVMGGIFVSLIAVMAVVWGKSDELD